jgi:hypothetical protein
MQFFSITQIWHVDDCVRRKGLQHRYFTILVQLNMIDENCGGTEVWSKELVRGDLVSRQKNLYYFGCILPVGEIFCSFLYCFISDSRQTR